MVYLIAPDELRLPGYIKHDVCDTQLVNYCEVKRLEDVIGKLDVLYMTRVQKERFLDEDEFDRVKNSFVLDCEKLKAAKPKMAILHPLPRVNEIRTEVDADPRAAYFRQVENGKFVRMSLMYSLLKWKDDPTHTMPAHPDYIESPNLRCSNPKCICNNEDTPHLFRRTDDGSARCIYCDSKVR